jgi:hypothetical protein
MAKPAPLPSLEPYLSKDLFVDIVPLEVRK